MKTTNNTCFKQKIRQYLTPTVTLYLDDNRVKHSAVNLFQFCGVERMPGTGNEDTPRHCNITKEYKELNKRPGPKSWILVSYIFYGNAQDKDFRDKHGEKICKWLNKTIKEHPEDRKMQYKVEFERPCLAYIGENPIETRNYFNQHLLAKDAVQCYQLFFHPRTYNEIIQNHAVMQLIFGPNIEAKHRQWVKDYFSVELIPR